MCSCFVVTEATLAYGWFSSVATDYNNCIIIYEVSASQMSYLSLANLRDLSVLR